MHPDLDVQRRVLVKCYRLYLDADRAWTVAVEEARAWFPTGRRPVGALLGDPRSRIRRLYEARERALQRLLIARDKLERSRQRLLQRQAQVSAHREVWLISV